MTKKFNLCIVIPCFNEARRLDVIQLLKFISVQPKVLVCFVNDGSTDDTLNLLKSINNKFGQHTHIYSLKKNSGKAEAVRAAFLHCLSKFKLDTIAYLDADLATSMEECLSLSNNISTQKKFVFGSRIKKIDNHIERKGYRFLIGRFIATLISRQLKLPVYDTQCGCKIFDSELAELLFEKPFISKWLFDVELFHRLIKRYGIKNTRSISSEIPLKSWVDIGDSKVKFSYFFKLWYDLYSIGKAYSRN